MPHMDDMRCKHCGALIALIPRTSVVGRFALKCGHCGVLLVIWPPSRTKAAQPEPQPEVAA